MKIKLKQKNPNNPNEWIEKETYIDGWLKANLDRGMQYQKKKFDQVWFIDGEEGAGKTTLATTCAYYVSPPERRHNLLDRIVVKIEDADKTILNAKFFDSIVVDEGYGGMSSTGFMNRVNSLLRRRFTEIRAKKLFTYIVAPTFMDIYRYYAIWRSKCLLHVYTKGTERGRCAFYNKEGKKKLYIIGRKKFYNYSCVTPNFIFKFTDEMPKLIDINAYEDKKRKSTLERTDEENKIPSRTDFIKESLINNLKLKKPITQEQLAGLFQVSTRRIQRFIAKSRGI